MIRSIKVMLLPNNKQKTKLFQFANTARFAYNWAIAREEESYKNCKKFISDCDLRKEFTQLKKQERFQWLNEISCDVPKQAIKDACEAYKKFFKRRCKYPKFKSKKKSTPSFYQDNFKIQFESRKVFLSGIGLMKLAEKNRFPIGKGKHKEISVVNPRITYDGLNWWISVGIECENSSNIPFNEGIGIDLGIKDLAICSDGNTYKNINKTRDIKQLEKKLLKLNRRLSNVRHNYIHQTTSEIINRKPMFIVLEDLNVKGMMKNKHLSKSIQEQCFYEFRRQIEYKSDWNNIKFIVAGRFFPSSKLCSNCGCVNKQLKLSDRVFIYPECGNTIDRDYQASLNLKAYGENVLQLVS